MGSALPAAVSGNGSVVFGLDERGEIALAGTIENGRVTFSPEGTVLALGTTVLRSLFPDQSAETLGRRLRETSGFSGLVTDIRDTALAGRNPLQDVNVQERFKSIIRAAVENSSASTNQSRPLAVANRRLEPTLEPTILPISSTSKVSLWNSRAPGSPNLEKIVLLRNTSSLNFTAALLDPSGALKSSAQLVGGGIVRHSTVEITKPFNGSFSVRLMFDSRATAVDAVKATLGLFPYLDSNCVVSAAVAAGSLAADARLKAQPITWLDAVLSSAWSASDCGDNKGALIKVLGVISKVADVIDLVRIAADYSQLPDAIDDVGVCVNSFHTRISCIKRIEVSEILPMMPSAAQSITIEYWGEDDKKTTSPPYGLEVMVEGVSEDGLKVKVEGLDNELFSLSRTEGVAQITSNTVNRVGTRTVTLRDPATGIKRDFTVKVTNGKLDKPTYSIAPGSTVELRLVDPGSGSEVIRGATFDIHLPGSTTTYGRFSTQGETRGPILFRASEIELPGPQAIILNGSDSGSTISASGSARWAVRFWLESFGVSRPGRADVGRYDLSSGAFNVTTTLYDYSYNRSTRPALFRRTGKMAVFQPWTRTMYQLDLASGERGPVISLPSASGLPSESLWAAAVTAEDSLVFLTYQFPDFGIGEVGVFAGVGSPPTFARLRTFSDPFRNSAWQQAIGSNSGDLFSYFLSTHLNHDRFAFTRLTTSRLSTGEVVFEGSIGSNNIFFCGDAGADRIAGIRFRGTGFSPLNEIVLVNRLNGVVQKVGEPIGPVAEASCAVHSGRLLIQEGVSPLNEAGDWSLAMYDLLSGALISRLPLLPKTSIYFPD